MTDPRHPSAALAAFAAGLRFDAIPASVVRRTEDLFLDWAGSALAGKGARPVEAIAAYARAMGPASGGSEVLISRRTSSFLTRGNSDMCAPERIDRPTTSTASCTATSAIISGVWGRPV